MPGPIPSIVLRQREALTGQVVKAVVLFIGFYLLALLTVVLLLLTPFFVIDAFGFFSPYLVLSAYGVALLILVAVVPRPDRFTPPGLRLNAGGQPRVFQLIADVAERTGQDVPAEVYLTPGVTAFVAQRGGILGLGSRRVMAVGLGLLQVLSLSEFEAVLAHEFGHYYAGHLKLGPWIYQARMAMVRAVESLGEWGSGLYAPYRYYVLTFLRVTQKISRTQEFVADELAARLYGTEVTISSLRLAHAGAVVFNAYWRDEIAPRLRAGYRPLVLEGFARLIRRGESAATAMPRNTTQEMAKSKAGSYDSHPSLAERISALEGLPIGGANSEAAARSDEQAICLLDAITELEGLLLQHICGPRTADALKPVTWEPADGEMTLTNYEELVRQHARRLKGLTPLSLLPLSGHIERFSTRMIPTPGGLVESDLDFVNDLAITTLGAALMLALRQTGWQVQLLPGEHPVCTRGGETFEPFKVVQRLSAGRVSSQSLKQQFTDAGIAGIDLGSVASPATQPV